MVALNNAADNQAGSITTLDVAVPTNEEELEAKARALHLNDDGTSSKESPARDDPDLLPEERWNEAWQNHLESLKVRMVEKERSSTCVIYLFTTHTQKPTIIHLIPPTFL